MPKGAFEDLTRALESYEKSGAGKRDVERQKREDEEKRKREQEKERERREREGRGAVGARVRQGFKNREEMLKAIESEKASRDLFRKPIILHKGRAAPRE